MNMSKINAWLVKILLFLFALNSLSLCLYFFFHSKSLTHTLTHDPTLHPFTVNRLFLTDNYDSQYNPRYSKPWPILPSYLPWSQIQLKTHFRSCEAYFGNGFTRRVDLIRHEKTLSGWFRCWFSETLRSSVCEGGRVRMSPERIKMSKGGETLGEVIGRSEDDEMPDFENGAFDIDGGDGFVGERRKFATQGFLDQYVPQGQIVKHTMHELIGSVRVVPAREFECDEDELGVRVEGLVQARRATACGTRMKNDDDVIVCKHAHFNGGNKVRRELEEVTGVVAAFENLGQDGSTFAMPENY